MTTEHAALPQSRPLRRLRRAGLIAVAGLVVYVLLGLAFFVFPPQDPLPEHADVALVLGPATPPRMATAYRLLDDGVVDHVIVSVIRDPMDRAHADASWTARCATLPDTTCAVADPYTTQGEARILRAQTAEHGYRSSIVVTQTAHLVRARTIVARCFAGRITMRSSGEQPSYGWPYEFAYQTAATVKAWFVTNTC